MRGITIIKGSGKTHTGNDLGLVQEEKTIGAPAVQSYLVEVPGRNGLLNLTDSLTGHVCYENRDLKFKYLATGKRTDLQEIGDLFNLYHGETIKIIDDDTPDYFYTGEASIEETWDGPLLFISMSVDANPFKESLNPKIITSELTAAAKEIVIKNDGLVAVPTITTTGETKLIINNKTYSLSAGTYRIIEFELLTGANVIQASGSGTLSIEYREAKI